MTAACPPELEAGMRYLDIRVRGVENRMQALESEAYEKQRAEIMWKHAVSPLLALLALIFILMLPGVFDAWWSKPRTNPNPVVPSPVCKPGFGVQKQISGGLGCFPLEGERADAPSSAEKDEEWAWVACPCGLGKKLHGGCYCPGGKEQEVKEALLMKNIEDKAAARLGCNWGAEYSFKQGAWKCRGCSSLN